MEKRYFKYLDNEVIKNAFDNFDKGKRSQKNVYHYTSLNSFYNILQSKSFYFTSIEEQNDPQELIFGLKVLKKIIKCGCKHNITILHVIDQTDKLESWSRINNIFIFATAADSDDYSQWIKYGDRGAGVSIGIERVKLIKLMIKNLDDKTLIYNYPIQYYKGEKNVSKNKIQDFELTVINTLDRIAEKYLSQNGSFNTRKDFFNLLSIFASLIKDSFHKEEHEWRYMVISDILDETDDSEIIVQNNLLKMIKKIKFDTNSKANPILNEFILGPIHTYNRNQSINMYKLLKQNYKTIDINRIKYSKGIIR